MWFLRARCHRTFWTGVSALDEGDVARAARDFPLRPIDAGKLSVYLIEEQEDGGRAAMLHELISERRPETIDYLMFPTRAVIAAGFSYSPVQHPGLPQYLSERHYEILHFSDEQAARRLARAILASGQHRVCRLTRTRLIDVARDYIRNDPAIVPRLGMHWRLELSD